METTSSLTARSGVITGLALYFPDLEYHDLLISISQVFGQT